MILQPDWITEGMVDAAVAKGRGKLGEPPASLRLETLDEGLCVQTMHVGSYDDEGPVLARLHEEYLPQHGLKDRAPPRGSISATRARPPPEKLKTILRQPVRPRQ